MAGLKVREPSAVAGDEPQSFMDSSGRYVALPKEDVCFCLSRQVEVLGVAPKVQQMHQRGRITQLCVF